MPTPTSIISPLAELRKSKGLSQNEMADILNVSRPTYSDWERNPLKMPLGSFMKFVEYFRCSYDETLKKIANTKINASVNPSLQLFDIMDKLIQLENLISLK